MTTGRINQVTTLAHSAASQPASPESPVRQPTERGAHAARASFNSRSTEPSVADRSARLPHTTTTTHLPPFVKRKTDTAISKRLPNTPCEAGILKTVEFVTNVNQSEPFVPDRLRKPTIVHAGIALAVRLSAGHFQPRHS